MQQFVEAPRLAAHEDARLRQGVVEQITSGSGQSPFVGMQAVEQGGRFDGGARLPQPLRHVIVLEGVQDPGNVGTVIRTANALGMDAVVLTGACADLYSPKTVRAAMGALFRQPVLTCTTDELLQLLEGSEG